MSELTPAEPTDHRSRPTSKAFKDFIASGWSQRDSELPKILESARYAAPRRELISSTFPNERLVIPAGPLKVRSNDCDYEFRPHSDFAYLTGLGADREPDAVLVIGPSPTAATLFFRPRAERDTEEFYANARYGELWVGVRPSLAELSAELGLDVRHLDELAAELATGGPIRMIAQADPSILALVAGVRPEVGAEVDAELATALSRQRLVKDEWEQNQLRAACAATVSGFTELVRGIPEAVAKGRGERWIEGKFGLIARHAGNGVGYSTIAAAGDHSCTLHWIRNDGPLRPGELLLVDAGVELDSLFTADVTRTMPINGRFSPAQLKVYRAVLAAQEAGLAAVKPGNTFKQVHEAAIKVIAEHLAEWGLLPSGVDVTATLAPEGGYHRRWMVHGTSHHLGLDVHDCAHALRADYLDGPLLPGMVLTVEPGLYFMPQDELVPTELRGIGIRIEDDVLVTETGCENLSAALPRMPEEIEEWMSRLMA